MAQSLRRIYNELKMRKLNFWIIQRAEQTIYDDRNARLMRSGIIANQLEARGHKVTLWTSAFNHMEHKHRFDKSTLIKISDNFTIQFIKSIGYKKNFSFRRLVDEKYISLQFKSLLSLHEKPDVILISMPSIELGYEVSKYAKKNQIPFFVDIRDLWPDVFYDVSKAIFHPLIFPIHKYYEFKLKKLLYNSTGIIALTESYLKWGLKKINRRISIKDKVINMGYIHDTHTENLAVNNNKIEKLNNNNFKLVVTFIGTLGKTNNLEPVLEAARRIEDKQKKILFIVCGSGEKLNFYKSKYSNLSNVTFMGWLDGIKIREILKISDVGILPYIESNNYKYNIPNKPAEYMSEGLVLASSLNDGELYSLIVKSNIGFSYKHNSDILMFELENLLNKPNLVLQLKKNSITTFETHFNAKKLYNDLIQHIEKKI